MTGYGEKPGRRWLECLRFLIWVMRAEFTDEEFARRANRVRAAFGREPLRDDYRPLSKRLGM